MPTVFILVGIYVILEGIVKKLYFYWKTRRQFAAEPKKDLKKADPRFQRYSVRKMIHSKEPEVLEAREKIVKCYKRLKKKKPLYYHFSYAFGTLTLMGLFRKRRKRCSNTPFKIIIEICGTREARVVTETATVEVGVIHLAVEALVVAEQVQICKTVEEYPRQFFC